MAFKFESRAAAQGFKVLCSQIFEQSTSAAVGSFTRKLPSETVIWPPAQNSLFKELSFSNTPHVQPEVSTNYKECGTVVSNFGGNCKTL